MSKLLVTGSILLPPGFVLPHGAVAYVRLLDTSLADAPSTVVAEQAIEGIAAGKEIGFALYGEIRNWRADYNVSVHIDVDGDRRVSVGDCITVQSYPVITFGRPRKVRVQTVQVR